MKQINYDRKKKKKKGRPNIQILYLFDVLNLKSANNQTSSMHIFFCARHYHSGAADHAG